jgi:CRISPR-associated endonuclease Csn1
MQPVGVLDVGVRIFPDGRNPKDGSSLASARRQARSVRRNRDRYLRRRANLLNALTRFGLLPENEAERRGLTQLDPYKLRARAIVDELKPFELGRLLFHLNQRRGFKSNRKVDRAGDNESGLIRLAARELSAHLLREGHPTLGAFLAARHARHEQVRIRLAGTGKTAAYPFYPLREMVEAEFDAIWQVQSGYNADLTDTVRDRLKHIIFHQRPLRDPPIGRCWLESAEPRGYRAMPTAQAFRIAQDLAHLRLSQPGIPGRALEEVERAILRDLLLRGSDLSFDQIRKRLKLAAETDFNLASMRKDKLVGAETAHRLGSKKAMGVEWHALPLEMQDVGVAAILSAKTDEEAATILISLGFDATTAVRAAGVALPDGTTSLSIKAMGRILPHLNNGPRYSSAVQAAGYAHHSDQRTGEVRERLPYYGELLFERIGTGTGKLDDVAEKRWGRAPNSTVHVALNEVRRVVNALIDKHGIPTEIVIETLRDLGRSAVQKREAEREQKKNQEANDRRRKALAEMGLPIKDNLIRLRLWEEQAADPQQCVCPYTGTLITARMALSDAVEEDHILPFAVSPDDSTANRVLVMREANRQKARRTPFEAFGHTSQWAEIQKNIDALPANKRWRFAPDAMKKLAADGDFLARHLTDSATIARLVRMYLEVLAPGKVWSTPGRLTALIRAKLGLNSDVVLGKGGPLKNRVDQRHHAIDAVVVALTDRGLLQRVSRAAAYSEAARGRLIDALGEPWPGFVSEIARAVRGIVVSYKPDTGWQGALHNDTAYGPVMAIGKQDPNVVLRRPLVSLAEWSNEDIESGVRDPTLAAEISAALDTKDDPTARKASLTSLTHSGGHLVRRVRVMERLNNVEAIHDRRSKLPYKVVKLDGNHRAELWRLPTGKAMLTVVSTFEAAQEKSAKLRGGKKPAKDLRPHPAAKLLLRLHKNDMVAVGLGAERRFLRVVKMMDRLITLAPHSEGGNLKARDARKDDAFKYVNASALRLIEMSARKVWVDPAGRVRDPGPLP